jgi:hypothetical protein
MHYGDEGEKEVTFSTDEEQVRRRAVRFGIHCVAFLCAVLTLEVMYSANAKRVRCRVRLVLYKGGVVGTGCNGN